MIYPRSRSLSSHSDDSSSSETRKGKSLPARRAGKHADTGKPSDRPVAAGGADADVISLPPPDADDVPAESDAEARPRGRRPRKETHPSARSDSNTTHFASEVPSQAGESMTENPDYESFETADLEPASAHGLENATVYDSEDDDLASHDNYDATDDDYEGAESTLAANQVLVTLSYSLVSQIRQVARMEGVTPEDIIIELLAEGVTKRAFQDMNRPVPSHLMTRTGYVPPEANGNVAQPALSHHGQQQNARNSHGGGNQRRFQGNGNYNGNGNGNYNRNNQGGQNNQGRFNKNQRPNRGNGGGNGGGNVNNFRGNRQGRGNAK